MTSCAYCGNSIDSQSFICEACANPKLESNSKEMPSPQKELQAEPREVLSTNKPVIVEPPKTDSIEIRETIKHQELNPEIPASTALTKREQPGEKTPRLEKESSRNNLDTGQNSQDLFTTRATEENPSLDSPTWQEEQINKDLSAKVLIFNLVFIVLPLLAMVIITLLLKLDSTIKVTIIMANCMVFSVSAVAHFIEMRWLKYASYIYRITDPVDAYVYLESNNPVLIKIYDEDNMYPEFSGITSISPKSGNIELLGVKPRKMNELVPVKIKVGQYGPLKALILEANGHRVWCKFNKRSNS